jgi:hypothetical protein
MPQVKVAPGASSQGPSVPYQDSVAVRRQLCKSQVITVAIFVGSVLIHCLPVLPEPIELPQQSFKLSLDQFPWQQGQVRPHQATEGRRSRFLFVLLLLNSNSRIQFSQSLSCLWSVQKSKALRGTNGLLVSGTGHSP